MNKTYKKTRIKLTFLYFIIIFIIVTAFSIAIVQGQDNDFQRLLSFQAQVYYFSPFHRFALQDSERLNNVVNQVRTNLITRVIEADTSILLISILLSYFLSGKTLKPIEDALEKQKQFVADASHELKTPLTSIQTEAEVLLHAERSTEEYKKFAKSVLEETQRLSDLAISLLSIARSDSNNYILHTENVNLNLLIKVEIKKFIYSANSRQIEIHFFKPAKDFFILCNNFRIKQLVDILLDNAIKYNKDKGSIFITLKEEATSQISLIIQDTGIGIAKENLNKVFDRFYRISQDRHTKGFGLGLSIAKEIVNENHATIHIESKPDEGTKVKVLFKLI